MPIKVLRKLCAWKTAAKQAKYVLCVPHGGLNDVLCQISKCVEYAEQHRRTLIIDTKKSGLFRDFDDFFEFIDINTAVHTHTSAALYQQLNTSSCYPPQCQGQLNHYVTSYNRKLKCHAIIGQRRKTSFAFNRRYAHQCLVHETCGGGLASMKLLPRLQLCEALAQRVRQQLAVLGEDYVAIHVRHTDYQTDYKKYFKTIRSQLENKRVLVCSDNSDVIEHARIFFQQADVITTSGPQLSGGQCLHVPANYSDEQQRHDAPHRAIIDLIALACAKTIHIPQIININPNIHDGISGFARLAKTLAQNKQVIQQLTRMA